MSDFVLSSKVDNNKVFLIKRSDLEGRFQVEFYKPNIAKLEHIIKKKSTKTLRDYCLGMASGATPKSDEQDRYYSDAENGIPFLRVQNLETNGTINYDNFKYINKETHNGLLKRSQISGGDLLIKITGVGRMAIASVVPEGFVGNINQHIVAIKTENRNISEYLSRYFNLDIIERIASRHSTGGTRPALDFPSLLNLPIIENIDFAIIDKAISLRADKLRQAKELLDSIDTYLLDELGITLPKTHYDGIKDRMFLVKHSDVVGKRVDSYFYQKVYTNIDDVFNQNINSCLLGDVIMDLKNGVEIRDYVDCGLRYLRVTDLGSNGLNHLSPKYVKTQYIPHKVILNNNCIIISRSGSLGLINQVEPYMLDYILSSHIFRVELNTNLVYPYYLVELLRSSICQPQFVRLNNGGVIPEIHQTSLKSIKIIIPSLDKQIEIANTISSIRQQAKDLELEGEKILDDAKKEIEKKILG